MAKRLKTEDNGKTRKAFIFSLDAFVALSVILVTIYALFALVSTPKPYYTSFEQTYDFSRDTLIALEHSDDAQYGNMLSAVAAGRESTIELYVDPAIPKQYGYRFEFYNTTSEEWHVIYDTATDSADPLRNREYRKMKASAQTIVFSDVPGSPSDENLFGYISCDGDATPCDMPEPLFDPGDSAIGIIRLTVYI